ncbi:MAG: chromosome segregation protein SMC [Coriobacteriia bacterium]|nr:chromosome segregation protein SMC [Coriobacteriia bacterium]
MYLKSLTLKGFKSFADKSVFSVEPGVTCVVGPNGSGKSNISDAVLWVLGEQSAKTLRGQAMEDIIFAGSSARQALGVAEVDLVLDNTDGTLPLEFSEVTITRRMYRSGESEYLINQSPSRLMDILDMLHDTGLGRDAHSIISQGRLTEVLNARPEDRRSLIEEAAGVLKHKKRKERALRKLSGLDAHLERAADIANEIERQLRPLERQAAKAKTHAELISELREIDVSCAVDDLRRLQTDWNDVLKKEREAEVELDLVRYQLEERERELEKYQHLLEDKGLFVGDISEQRRRVNTILERFDAGLLLLEEKGKNLINRLSELRMQLHGAQSRIGGACKERDVVAASRAETDASLKELYTQLGEIRRESESTRKERALFDEEVSKIASSLRSQRARADERRNAIAKRESALSSLSIQTDLLKNRKDELGEQIGSSQETLSQRRTKLASLEKGIAKAKREIAMADSDVDKRVRVLDSRRNDLQAARDRFFDARAEIKGLEEVDRAFATASPALARVVSRAAELDGFVGPVADFISADAEYEQLVEKLLGADLFGVFVKDAQGAMAVAHEVKNAEAGEISIIPLDAPPISPKASKVGKRLLDFVTFDESHRAGVEVLFGDVYVVDSLQTAISSIKHNPEIRFVTKEGAVVWPSGKVTLGTQIADNEGVLARKRRLNSLSDTLGGLEISVAEAEGDVAVAEEALMLAQQDAFGLNQKAAQITGEYNSLLAEIGRLEESLARITQEEAQISTRLEEVVEKADEQIPALEALKAEAQEQETVLEELQERAAGAEYDRSLKLRDETAVNERLSKCQVDMATVSEREVHMKRELNQLVAEISGLKETIESSNQTEQALEMLRSRIQPLHDLYKDMHEQADRWSLMLRDRAKLEQSDSESLRSTITSAQDAVKTAQAIVNEKTEGIMHVRVAKGQLEVQVNAAVRHIVEELGMPIEKALALPLVENRLAVEDHALSLRKKVSNLGAINSVAKDEYEALSARRDFMRSQIEDLKSARTALNKVVGAIDRKIKTLFLDTFEQVDKHFQAFFAILFPGGSAQLLLSDPDDPDNTGVEFIALPRGKKLKKMSLLSGGEQSLAALALLFAVNQVRPCPFFILDEVEAALDDSNLQRFVNFVDKMRQSTQFLIVTHQRRTMEMADLLYGVSMQADGVSKLLSQKLENALELVESES